MDVLNRCQNCAKVNYRALFPVRLEDDRDGQHIFAPIADLKNESQKSARPSFRIADTVNQLIRSAQAGCYFCRYICYSARIRPLGRYPLDKDSSVTNIPRDFDTKDPYHTGPVYITSRLFWNSDGILVISVEDGRENVEVWPSLTIQPWGISISGIYGIPCRLTKNGPCAFDLKMNTGTSKIRTYPEISPAVSPLADSVFNCITQWTNECCESHSSCQDVLDFGWTTKLKFVRFVDVSPTSDNPLWLKIVSVSDAITGQSTSTPKYIALSYKWGDEKPHITTEDNLKTRENKGFSLSELPPSLIDAVTICRRIGIRYIWIDSLCIIQSTIRNPSGWATPDFLQHVVIMDQIYSGAFYTLAAAFSEGTNDKILKRRDFAVYNAPQVQIPLDSLTNNSIEDSKGPRRSRMSWAKSKHYDRAKTEYDIRSLPVTNGPVFNTYTSNPDWDKAAVDTVIETRGWCFQEKILSHRVLYFTPFGLFWECRQITASEMKPDGYSDETNDYARFDPIRNASLLRTFIRDAALEDKQSRHSTWLNIVEGFSKRELSRNGDRLNAFRGVQNEWRRRTGRRDGCFYGIWEEDLVADLAWIPTSNGRNWRQTPEIPSWSWGCLHNLEISYSGPDLTLDFKMRPRKFRPPVTLIRWKIQDPGNIDSNASDRSTGASDNKADHQDLPEGALVLRATAARVPWSTIRKQEDYNKKGQESDGECLRRWSPDTESYRHLIQPAWPNTDLEHNPLCLRLHTITRETYMQEDEHNHFALILAPADDCNMHFARASARPGQQPLLVYERYYRRVGWFSTMIEDDFADCEEREIILV